MKNRYLFLIVLSVFINTLSAKDLHFSNLRFLNKNAIANFGVLEDSTSEFQKFKKNVEKIIYENEKIISDLKSKIEEKGKEYREAHQKRISELEQKNNELMKTIQEYKDDKKEKLETFKTEFTHEMDELVKSLKKLASDKNTDDKNKE